MRFLYLWGFLAIQRSSTARIYLPPAPELCYSHNQPETVLHSLVIIFRVDEILSLDKTYDWPLTTRILSFLILLVGTAVAQWLRCCATNRKVAGSNPAGVIGFFY